MDLSVVQSIKVYDPEASTRTLRNPSPTITCYDYYEPKRTVFFGQSNGVLVQKARTHELAPSATDDFTFKYQWRVTSTQVYNGHKGSITSVCYVPDPVNLLFSGSADRTIKVWDPWIKLKDAPRKCLQTLLGHGGTVTGLAYELVVRPDETRRLYLMSGSTDGSVRVWTTEDGREQILKPWLTCSQTIPNLGGWVSSICYSPNEHLPSAGHLTAATSTGHVHVFSQQRGKEFHLVSTSKRRPHQVGVTTVKYSRKDDYWITLAHDMLVKVYDGQTGSEFFRFSSRHGVRFAGVAWNSEQRELYVVDEAGWLYVWNTYEEKLLYSAKLRGFPLGEVMLLRNKDHFAIASSQELIFAEVTRQHVWMQYKGHVNAILGLFVEERGAKIEHRLYSGSVDDSVRCWIPLDLTVDRVWSSFEAEMSAFLFVPSMRTFVTGHDDGSILMWNHDSGTAIIMEGHENAITCMALSNTRGHEYLISGGYEGWLGVWDVHRAHAGGSILIQMFAAHETEIMSVATHNPKEYIFSGDNDGLIKVWHMEHHDFIGELEGHTGPVNTMAIDANFLFSGSDDGDVRMWDVVTLSPLSTFKALHRGHIRGITMLPQGYLVSVCDEGRIVLTDYISEEQLKEWRHDGQFTCVAYRKDSFEVLAGTSAGSIVVFPLPDQFRSVRSVSLHVSQELQQGRKMVPAESKTSLAGNLTLMRQMSSSQMHLSRSSLLHTGSTATLL